MSKDVVISVEGLGKCYQIAHQEKGVARRSDTLSERIQNAALDTLHRMSGFKKIPAKKEEFWALRDLSLEIRRGDVLGIIGHNGAGKSTLLKILSRITEPTTGRMRLRGKISALLEVGTGFHPELTGRENIFLNGAILGMSRQEVRASFDEIVEFAGVAQFLGTPVKHYSSGMYVRLAFAVAAHLRTEILIIDEVLAVGDGEFQKKCLGKMDDIANEGRTLLFVSHNMGLISSLCQRVILLDQGRISIDSNATEAVLSYYTNGRGTPFNVDFTKARRSVSGYGATLLSGTVEDPAGNAVSEVYIKQNFQVRIRYRLEVSPGYAPYPNFHVTDNMGNYVFVTSPSNNQIGMKPGVYEAVCNIPGSLLNNGTYFIGLALTFRDKGVQIAFFEKDALCVNIIDPIEDTLDTERNGYSGPIPGVVRPRLNWTVNQIL